MKKAFYVKFGRKRIQVVVFDTLIELRREGKLRGDPDTRRMYAFFDRTRGRVPTVAFARKYTGSNTGSNTVAHEATHIGFWLAPKKKGICYEEPLANAVGKVMSALEKAFYKHGVYKQ